MLTTLQVGCFRCGCKTPFFCSNTSSVTQADDMIMLFCRKRRKFEDCLTQSCAGGTRREVRNVFTDEESLAMIGMPERLVGKMEQRIGNVSTTNGSASQVGVFDQGVDTSGLFKRAQ